MSETGLVSSSVNFAVDENVTYCPSGEIAGEELVPKYPLGPGTCVTSSIVPSGLGGMVDDVVVDGADVVGGVEVVDVVVEGVTVVVDDGAVVVVDRGPPCDGTGGAPRGGSGAAQAARVPTTSSTIACMGTRRRRIGVWLTAPPVPLRRCNLYAVARSGATLSTEHPGSTGLLPSGHGRNSSWPTHGGGGR